MPHDITDIPTLEALYGTPGRASLDKVATALTPLYRRWIDASRFCILSTIGPEGTDASPRGDDGP
ncbi:MAG: pyridoxamine 5'-phosphate oxidase family protein, partial [Pseudomonadota bacterium]